MNPIEYKARGVGFTVAQTPYENPPRDRFTVPAHHFGLRIRAEWNGGVVPTRALADWLCPAPDTFRTPLARCLAFGPCHIEADVYGEHAAAVLHALQRMRPARLLVHSVSL